MSFNLGQLVPEGNPTDIKNAGNSSGGKIMQASAPVLKDLFSKLFGGGKENPNDWKGWTDDACRYWTHVDGDSVSNEVVNIAQYFQSKGLENLEWMLKPSNQSPPLTPSLILGKFTRGGYAELGQQYADLLQQYITAKTQPVTAGTGSFLQNPVSNPVGGFLGGGTGSTPAVNTPAPGVPQPTTKQAGFQWLFILVPLGLLGAAVYNFLTGTKTRRRY